MSPGQGIGDVFVGGMQMNYPLCVVMDFYMVNFLYIYLSSGWNTQLRGTPITRLKYLFGGIKI